MAKKTVTKKKRKLTLAPLRRMAIMCFCACLMMYFGAFVINEFKTSIDLKEDIYEAELLKAQLSKELETVSASAERLNDANYIAHKARSEYDLIEKGQTLFRLPIAEKEEK